MLRAASVVGFACGLPVVGRQVDRRGQGTVLIVAATVHCAAMALAYAPDFHEGHAGRLGPLRYGWPATAPGTPVLVE